MKKQKLNIKACYDLSHWKYTISLDEIRSDLIQLEKINVTDIEISIENDYDDYYVLIEPIISRVETDKEYNDRILKEKVIQEQIKNRELEQLKKLKDKYENI